jgi:WD40 repeat protein
MRVVVGDWNDRLHGMGCPIAFTRQELFMKPWQGVLASLGIIGIVAAGAWHAADHASAHSALSSFATETTSSTASLFSVKSVNWSADGRMLLSLSRGERGSSELSLSLHDTFQKTDYLPINVPDEPISCASLAPDGLRVLVATYGGQLLWIDLQSVEPVALVGLPDNECVTATAIADDGRTLAGGTDTGHIHLFGPTGKPSITLASAQRSSIGELSFSSDGRLLISTQNNGCVSLWNLQTGSLLKQFEGHDGPITAATILPGDSRIISAGLDDTIRIWDIPSGREEWHGEFGLGGVTTLAVSPDGTTAAWGGQNRKIVLWDLEHAKKKFEINSPASIVTQLRFSPDGASLAAAGNEGTIRLYDPRLGCERLGIDVRQFVESVNAVNGRNRPSRHSSKQNGA